MTDHLAVLEEMFALAANERGMKEADACAAAIALMRGQSEVCTDSPDGSWLWCKLMDYLRQKRMAPAEHNDLMRIATLAHSVNSRDREVLKYLMHQFDGEVHVCERCGYEEPTKDFDSALYLRRYLYESLAIPAPPKDPADEQ